MIVYVKKGFKKKLQYGEVGKETEQFIYWMGELECVVDEDCAVVCALRYLLDKL